MSTLVIYVLLKLTLLITNCSIWLFFRRMSPNTSENPFVASSMRPIAP